jgi:TDG/mug DNA glycosylase family protein
MPLKDVLIQRPRILFVGINPGLRSEAIGHHFGGPGNPFWKLLHAAKLTPVPLKAEEDRRLKEFGLALTNLCPRASRQASELSAAEIRAGKAALARKIRRLEPRLVALVGVSIYKAFYPAGPGGAGPKEERIAGAPLFVLPNPSGLNAAYPGFRHKLVWFEALREAASQADTTEPAP